jgi:hypothetical protein
LKFADSKRVDFLWIGFLIQLCSSFYIYDAFQFLLEVIDSYILCFIFSIFNFTYSKKTSTEVLNLFHRNRLLLKMSRVIFFLQKHLIYFIAIHCLLRCYRVCLINRTAKFRFSMTTLCSIRKGFFRWIRKDFYLN